MPSYPSNHYAVPASYITEIDGKYCIIHYGSPVSAMLATITQALAEASALGLDVSPKIWPYTPGPAGQDSPA